MDSAEYLFSYGTLQLEAVQMATFGRLLAGDRDILQGYELMPLEIEDLTVISISGKRHQTIARFTGRPADTIPRVVYALTPEEIRRADEYEVAPCLRISAVLQSGIRAWVYVDSRHQPAT